MKFFIVTTYGEMLDVALHLQDVEGHDVRMWIPDHHHARVGEGLIEKTSEYWEYLTSEWTWLVDGCERGAFQDYLRRSGVAVFGGSAEGDELENDRQAGQKIF